MSSRRPFSTMHSVNLDASLRSLQENYPYISSEKLEDLRSCQATAEQYRKTNEASKRSTDNQLQSYVLQGDLKYGYGTDRRPTAISSLCLAVIGSSGSGKSATGNTLLQSNEFPVSSSATANTMIEKTSCSRQSGVRVVDTPGSWTIPSKEHVHLYVLVINLASPRFSWQDLDRLKKLKDYNYILRSRRCILLLTHARDALLGRSLENYLQEIRGDPLHDLVVNEVGRGRVMAINNNCLTRYEVESQWKMIANLLTKAHQDAVYVPSRSDWREYLPVIIFVGVFLGFVFIVGMSIIGSANTKEDKWVPRN